MRRGAKQEAQPSSQEPEESIRLPRFMFRAPGHLRIHRTGGKQRVQRSSWPSELLHVKPIPYGGPFPPTVSSDLDTGNVTLRFLFLLILPQHSLGKGMVANEELPPGLNQARGPTTHSLPPDASGCRYRRVLCGAGGTILLTLTRSFAPTGPQGEISYRKVGGRAEGQTERAMSPAETLEEYCLNVPVFPHACQHLVKVALLLAA
ncbi:uncharacterized protein LOC107501608 isoform X1 [Rousettus aegyptiacus]|uniref:uncharacterized protein LOC107501608 isoform X1 n=1 Tax=Rousettus aegyptiacus TaxID=9407 RepID=UPI00168D41C2|nr:uncharacterized protein LOC107501608 isoform X1 [Rousettus aegyptiacus]